MRNNGRIYISEGICVNEASTSKECDVCHYWYFLNYKYLSTLVVLPF